MAELLPFFLLQNQRMTSINAFEKWRDEMTADFYLGLALILVAFFICYWFRNENRKK